MYRRTLLAGLLTILGLGLLPGVASAQQSISLNVGYFTVRGEDARPLEDVLIQDLNYHWFEIKDFHGATAGGEWLVPVGDLFEAGIGVAYYQRTVPTVYLDYVNEDGSEIGQDFKLRVVPMTAIVRFLPLGRRAGIQPYIGAGVGAFAWRYSETGEFIDENSDIFNGNFVDSGVNVGPVVVGGIRLPVTPGFAFGGEVRYQRAEGKLNGNDFNGTKIDLGGVSYQATLIFRF